MRTQTYKWANGKLLKKQIIEHIIREFVKDNAPKETRCIEAIDESTCMFRFALNDRILGVTRVTATPAGDLVLQFRENEYDEPEVMAIKDLPTDAKVLVVNGICQHAVRPAFYALPTAMKTTVTTYIDLPTALYDPEALKRLIRLIGYVSSALTDPQ